MNVFPIDLSIIVSLISAITLLGTPTEVHMSATLFSYSDESSELNES